VTGAVTGLLAASAGKDAERSCPASPCSDRDGLDASSRAHGLATVSTVGFIAGGVLAAGGLALVLWGGANDPTPAAHAARTGRLRVEAIPSAQGYGATLRLAGGLW
jgi:hypothetical protein